VLKSLRIDWFRSIVTAAAVGSPADILLVVHRMVDMWYPSTRDNYLAVFHAFAMFMVERGVVPSPPFAFAS
jgi:hypothetical protein